MMLDIAYRSILTNFVHFQALNLRFGLFGKFSYPKSLLTVRIFEKWNLFNLKFTV